MVQYEQPKDPVAAYRMQYEIMLKADAAKDVDHASKARIECASLRGQMTKQQLEGIKEIEAEVRSRISGGRQT